MYRNSKKPLTLKNRTNYFDPNKDRVRVHFLSPESYQSRQMKIEGYENRLYWQYKYCEDHNGQVFFYTLTYNNANLPHYEITTKRTVKLESSGEGCTYKFKTGAELVIPDDLPISKIVEVPELSIPCFDYEDLRDLLTGGFRKRLLRNYGTTFKYFIGAELGDGKGSRGMHNNPHYHVLFFLESAHSSKYPYVKIDPVDFRHLVRMYWQGFDEDTDGYRDYNEAKYGIAKEGENVGKVTDFRACCYCAKYVTKDVKLRQAEDKIEKKLKFKHSKEYRRTEDSYRDFFQQEIMPMFNTPLNAKKTEWCFSEVELIKELLGDEIFGYKDGLFSNEPENMDNESYMPYVIDIIKKEGLWQKYNAFIERHIAPLIKEGMNEWRNRYSNKCRISHGVGDYAMEHIQDKLNPSIQVPSKKGFKNRPINMYYYRKMYCNVVKDPSGQNLYVLNELGIAYKAANLPRQMKRKISKSKDYLPLLLDNPTLYEKMRDSDVNTEVFWSYPMLCRKVKRTINEDGLNEILKRYAEYKLVYEDRFFSYQQQGTDSTIAFPDINVIDDYKRFLVPSFYSVPRNDIGLAMFLEDIPENYMAYSQHPYFSRFIGIFHLLDLCADYFFIQGDNKSQRDAEERAATRRFHSQQRLRDFYAAFK